MSKILGLGLGVQDPIREVAEGNLLGSWAVLSPAPSHWPFPLLCCRQPVLQALSRSQQGITRGAEGRALEMLCFVFWSPVLQLFLPMGGGSYGSSRVCCKLLWQEPLYRMPGTCLLTMNGTKLLSMPYFQAFQLRETKGKGNIVIVLYVVMMYYSFVLYFFCFENFRWSDL